MGRLNLRYGRVVMLQTGRGDVPLTPLEALQVADELKAAAKKAVEAAAKKAAEDESEAKGTGA